MNNLKQQKSVFIQVPAALMWICGMSHMSSTGQYLWIGMQDNQPNNLRNICDWIDQSLSFLCIPPSGLWECKKRWWWWWCNREMPNSQIMRGNSAVFRWKKNLCQVGAFLAVCILICQVLLKSQWFCLLTCNAFKHS